jgi:hypothetical protein
MEGKPLQADLRDALIDAMRRPMGGDPGRPETVAVEHEAEERSLAPWLAEIGIACERTSPLAGVDHLHEAMSRDLGAAGPAPLLEVEDFGVERAESFFDAAAFFFRRAPWKQVADDATIELSCLEPDYGIWYAVVLGNAGLTVGLSLHRRVEHLALLRSGRLAPHDSAREVAALSLLYEHEDGIPIADLEAIERHGFAVAGADAYPLPIRWDPPRTSSRPSESELTAIEACLRGIPIFVERQRALGDRWRAALPAPGRVDFTLAWVDVPPLPDPLH